MRMMMPISDGDAHQLQAAGAEARFIRYAAPVTGTCLAGRLYASTRYPPHRTHVSIIRIVRRRLIKSATSLRRAPTTVNRFIAA